MSSRNSNFGFKSQLSKGENKGKTKSKPLTPPSTKNGSMLPMSPESIKAYLPTNLSATTSKNKNKFPQGTMKNNCIFRKYKNT